MGKRRACVDQQEGRARSQATSQRACPAGSSKARAASARHRQEQEAGHCTPVLPCPAGAPTSICMADERARNDSSTQEARQRNRLPPNAITTQKAHLEPVEEGEEQDAGEHGGAHEQDDTAQHAVRDHLGHSGGATVLDRPAAAAGRCAAVADRLLLIVVNVCLACCCRALLLPLAQRLLVGRLLCLQLLQGELRRGPRGNLAALALLRGVWCDSSGKVGREQAAGSGEPAAGGTAQQARGGSGACGLRAESAALCQQPIAWATLWTASCWPGGEKSTAALYKGVPEEVLRVHQKVLCSHHLAWQVGHCRLAGIAP